MPHWNMFADEVFKERHLLRDAGSARLRDLSTPDSYKAQALRELAHRLTLEEVLREVRQELAAAIDRFEEAECSLDIHHTWAHTVPCPGCPTPVALPPSPPC